MNSAFLLSIVLTLVNALNPLSDDGAAHWIVPTISLLPPLFKYPMMVSYQKHSHCSFVVANILKLKKGFWRYYTMFGITPSKKKNSWSNTHRKIYRRLRFRFWLKNIFSFFFSFLLSIVTKACVSSLNYVLRKDELKSHLLGFQINWLAVISLEEKDFHSI